MESRRFDLGVPEGSPLSPIVFVVFVDGLLCCCYEFDEAMVQVFVDDLTRWWIYSDATLGDDTLVLESGLVIETWVA